MDEKKDNKDRVMINKDRMIEKQNLSLEYIVDYNKKEKFKLEMEIKTKECVHDKEK